VSKRCVFRSSGERLDALPLVLVGPMVRAVGHRRATVWLALRRAARVVLTVHDTTDEPVLEGQAETMPFGQHLHLVLVEATGPADTLVPGRRYDYDLSFTVDGTSLSFAEAVGDLAALTYPGRHRPGFTMPPKALDEVRIAYGSCRLPHGEGSDALPAVDIMLEEGGADRPQMLFLIGDQIYADDVAPEMLAMIIDLETHLLGHREPLPGIDGDGPPPGARLEAARAAGLSSRHCENHLMSIGELTGMYLLVWSPVLWPETLPSAEDVYGDQLTAKKERDMLETTDKLIRFRAGLPRVRRMLANIATYTAFDDHEVTDDWFLNRGWTRTVLGTELGRRIIQNGMAAYGIFQGWGNDPETFGRGPGKQLISCLSTYMSEGFASRLDERIEALIGLPRAEEINQLIDRDPEQTVLWHYRIHGPQFEVWFLDTRTWRGFHGDDPDDIPDLISGRGWKQVTPAPLSTTKLTLVVAPTNVIDIPFTSKLSRWAAKLHTVYISDYGDTWEAQTEAYERLLSTLAVIARPEVLEERFVFLSGDVHYGFAARIQYWCRRAYKGRALPKECRAVFAHLTSSPFLNTNKITRLLHRIGHPWPFRPEPKEWAGWNEMPQLQITSWRGRLRAFFQGFRTRGVKHQPPLMNLAHPPRELRVGAQPDWRYRVDHIEGTAENRDEDRRGGREIVGANNAALLSFEIEDDHWQVRQTLWWREREDGALKPRTRFSVSLSLSDDGPYPRPLLPQEKQKRAGQTGRERSKGTDPNQEAEPS